MLAGMGAKSAQPQPEVESRESELELQILRAHPQWHTSFQQGHTSPDNAASWGLGFQMPEPMEHIFNQTNTASSDSFLPLDDSKLANLILK